MDKRIIIVLGNRLNDDGSMKYVLRERCLRALELMREGEGDLLLLTGGVVNKVAPRSEARAMEEFFSARGVVGDKIIIEEESRTTYQNAANCSIILKRLGVNKVLLVTSADHIYRSYFNPRTFFSVYFGIKFKAKPCEDTYVALPCGYEEGRRNIFVFGEKKDIENAVKTYRDCNIFAKNSRGIIRRKFFPGIVKRKDADIIAGRIKEMYGLKELERIE